MHLQGTTPACVLPVARGHGRNVDPRALPEGLIPEACMGPTPHFDQGFLVPVQSSI